MTESQSRYSIVERLTKTKLDIMSAKAQIDDEVKSKEQKVEGLKKDLKDWKEDIKQELIKTERDKERQIERVEEEAGNAKQKKESKEKTFDAKISAIDEALRKIEEISKTAPTN